MASIFTRIINGEIPSYKVAEDENFLAFLDINPLEKGHTLVVQVENIIDLFLGDDQRMTFLEGIDYIFDLDDETLQGMIVFAKRVAKKIQAKIACKRVAVVVFGLEVPHAHIHLIPMENEYDVDFRKVKPKFTPEEFEETARMIRE